MPSKMGITLFIGMWIGTYLLILFTMTRDNFWWMPGSPEWKDYFKGEGPVKLYKWRSYFEYVFKKRIVPVWTDHRDLIPAVISSLGLTLFIHSFWIAGAVTLFGFTAFELWYLKERKE